MAFDNVDFEGRTALVMGTSRGIGKVIVLDLTDRGANAVSTGEIIGGRKDPPRTIIETAEGVRERDGSSIRCQLDVCDDASMWTAIDETVGALGGTDLVINNVGAIHMAGFENAPPKRFDLLMNASARGTYAIIHAALPRPCESDYAHVVTFLSPIPARPTPRKATYALSKYGTTSVVQSLAGELGADDVGASTLWPAAATESEVTRHPGMGTLEDWHIPQTMHDAVTEPFSCDSTDCTGNAFYDEELLSEMDVDDFLSYVIVEGSEPGSMSAQLFDPDYEHWSPVIGAEARGRTFTFDELEILCDEFTRRRCGSGLFDAIFCRIGN